MALGPSESTLSEGRTIIVLGIILLVIGLLVGIPVLYYIGGILIIVGLILTILGAAGRGVGGRKTYF